MKKATLCCLAILSSTPLWAQEKKTEPKAKSAKAKETAAPAASAAPTTPANAPLRGRVSGMDSLFKIVQVGRTHEGVHMPISEDGKITTLVDAEKMTRVDENNIEFETAIINQKDKDGVIIHMPKGYYNKEADLLLSTQPAVVERADFRIEGDILSVDRRSNSYRMDGRVRFMYFGNTSIGTVAADHDKAAEGQPAAKETEKETAAPAPTPPPAPAPKPAAK